MFGLAVLKVVLSMLTKLREDSTLEMTLMMPVPFRYFEVATSVQDSSLLPHRIPSTRVAGDCTYVDGSDLKAGIVTKECWVSGVEIVPTSLREVGTRSPGASVSTLMLYISIQFNNFIPDSTGHIQQVHVTLRSIC